MDLGLAGRVYVVSGGSRGLGRATAEVLVAEGARVVLGARDTAAVERAAQELGGPAHAVGVTADLGTASAAQRLVEAAHSEYGGLDGALVSVGGPAAGSALGTEEDAWRAGFESVFLGSLRLARRVADAIGPDGGAIALVLSTSVRSPIPQLAVSNGLRPGLAGLAKTLAGELGPRGIRVNAVLPGPVWTPAIPGTMPIEEVEHFGHEVALARPGQPEELAPAFVFLASSDGSFATGSLVEVTGGKLG